MACTIAAGRIEGCRDSVGGLKAIYFINKQILPTDVTYDATNTDMITAIINVDSLYKYELRGDNGFDEDYKIDVNAGTNYVEQLLTLKLKKKDIATSKNLKLLSYAMPHVVVQNNSNQFFIMGLENGADVITLKLNHGMKMADFNGYDLVLKADEKCYANFLNAATEAAMVTLFTSATLVVG